MKSFKELLGEEIALEDVILEEDEVLEEGSITLGGAEHNTRRVPIKHHDEFKKTYPGSTVRFRGPKQGKDNTSKADATHFYIVNKKEKKVQEEAEIEEAKDTVVKDKEGKVTSWSHEGDWKKADKKDPVGKIHNMSDKALKKTQTLNKEETMSEFNPMSGYMSQIAKDVGVELQEKTLTPAELKKREEVAKAIERENPGMEMGKKMAIATSTAKKVAEDTHYCAKHVYSERFGEGFVVEGAHAEPDEQGLIEWYDVDFGGQIRRVMTEKVKVMHAEYHMNHKKKKMSEEDMEEAKSHTVPETEKEKDLAAMAHPKDKITHADVMVGRGVKKEEMSSKEKMKRGLYNKEETELEEEQLDELSVDTLKSYTRKVANIISGNNSKVASKARIKNYVKAQNKILAKEESELEEAMLSYSEFRDKIAMHKKAGNKVQDDKYSNDKATYTTVDKDGMGRKVTHTASGTKMETLGKMGKQDDDDSDEAEVKQTDKRGRGRPSGSKSGARRHN